MRDVWDALCRSRGRSGSVARLSPNGERSSEQMERTPSNLGKAALLTEFALLAGGHRARERRGVVRNMRNGVKTDPRDRT